MRGRQVALLSTALPSIVSAMSTSGMKAAPPKPTGQKMVSCHTGEKENGRLVKFKDAPAWFRPVLTPREMLLKGMHGGIYFNPKGGKPGVKYPRNKYPNGIPGVTIDEYPDKWFKGVPKELYASRRYDHKRNAYGVKSGLDQVGWETSGWINQCDPRGWTQVCVRVCDSKALSSLVSDFSHTRLSLLSRVRAVVLSLLHGPAPKRRRGRASDGPMEWRVRREGPLEAEPDCKVYEGQQSARRPYCKPCRASDPTTLGV